MVSFSLGKQIKKSSFVQNLQNPGVGEYHIDKFIKSSQIIQNPSTSIGKSKNRIKTIDVPGPGSYNHQRINSITSSNKGCLISKKNKSRVNSDGPGPTKYQLLTYKKKASIKYSFGHSKKNIEKMITAPDPATYNPSIKRHIPTAKLFIANKNPSDTFRTPGPGIYKYENYQIKKAAQFSFYHDEKYHDQKMKMRQKIRIPASNLYNINDTRREYKGNKFTSSKRKFLDVNENKMGPGDYTINNDKSQKCPVVIFGNSPRITLEKYENIPGPGEYTIPNIQQYKDKCPIAVMGRQKLNNYSQGYSKFPGPGSYQLGDKSRKTGISLTGRQFYEYKNKNPSPDTYNPNYSTILPINEPIKISTSRRFENYDVEIPGPGKYNSTDITSKHMKSFYFQKGSIKNHQSNPKVGPGSYDIKSDFN